MFHTSKFSIFFFAFFVLFVCSLCAALQLLRCLFCVILHFRKRAKVFPTVVTATIWILFARALFNFHSHLQIMMAKKKKNLEPKKESNMQLTHVQYVWGEVFDRSFCSWTAALVLSYHRNAFICKIIPNDPSGHLILSSNSFFMDFFFSFGFYFIFHSISIPNSMPFRALYIVRLHHIASHFAFLPFAFTAPFPLYFFKGFRLRRIRMLANTAHIEYVL